MALPFDLRTCAAADNEDGSRTGSTFRSYRGGRPSRAIVIPPDLVGRVQAHEVEAFRELVRLTYNPLLYFSRTIVRKDGIAEDIVQDVFAYVWDRASRWQPSGDPAAYLFGMVRNYALRDVRRRAREERRVMRVHTELTAQDKVANGSDERADTLDHIISDETDLIRARMIETVLEDCTERQRTAYELRYHTGLTVPAIAEVLEITPKGAEQLVRRVTHLVLAGLKQLLSEGSPEGE